MRGARRLPPSGKVTLENVVVPADHVIHVHQFAGLPNLYGPVSQIIQAAIDLGIARAYAARPGAVEILRDWESLSEWRSAAETCLNLKGSKNFFF